MFQDFKRRSEHQEKKGMSKDERHSIEKMVINMLAGTYTF
jgi:hypothetical protein